MASSRLKGEYTGKLLTAAPSVRWPGSVRQMYILERQSYIVEDVLHFGMADRMSHNCSFCICCLRMWFHFTGKQIVKHCRVFSLYICSGEMHQSLRSDAQRTASTPGWHESSAAGAQSFQMSFSRYYSKFDTMKHFCLASVLLFVFFCMGQDTDPNWVWNCTFAKKKSASQRKGAANISLLN